MTRGFLVFSIILVFSLVGIKALFHEGLFSAHDIWHQVARLYHYQKAVNDGQIPPYWIGNLANGYGYPLFFFSYHLPWILGLPFLGLGVSIPETLKILFISSYVFSGISMYLLVQAIFKNNVSALLSAIIYLWAPYRFLTILVDAAMGTSFAFTFLPILLLGIYKSCNDDILPALKGGVSPLKENVVSASIHPRHKWRGILEASNKRPNKGIILTAIGLSGIILSHFLSFIAVIPLSILFTSWSLMLNKELVLIKFKNLLLGLGLGLGISSFYLLPAVYYSKFTQVSTGTFSALYQNSFVNLSQILYSKWGYGLNKISAKEGQVPYQLGIAQWLSFATATVFLVSRSLRNLVIPTDKKFKKLALVIGTSLSLSIFSMLDLSKPFWDTLSNIIVFDSLTIFLLPATFTSALLSGWVFFSLKKPVNIIFFIFLTGLALYANRNHLRVNTYTDIPLELYVASEITTNSFHEYLPKTADIGIFIEENRLILPTNIDVIDFNQNITTFSILASFPEDTSATIRHLSFPGINLYLDGQRKEINMDELGRIKLNVSRGIHRIVVRFKETPLIRVSKLITIASTLALFFLINKFVFAKIKKTYAEKKEI